MCAGGESKLSDVFRVSPPAWSLLVREALCWSSIHGHGASLTLHAHTLRCPPSSPFFPPLSLSSFLCICVCVSLSLPFSAPLPFAMFDPEVLRLAQEQMNRLRPEDLQRMQQQMMSNPGLLRMASEGMKNIRPEDLKFAAQQMRNIPPDEIANMSSRVASATPEELAAMQSQNEAQQAYVLQGSQSLKHQGNQLHGIGKYAEAAEKYLRAKNNLVGIMSKEARDLELSCSLNLMSCYLKTKQFSDVVDFGSEVLSRDPNNLKALYRRGQAYKELGQLELAVPDLRRALELSPDDETIGNVYRVAKEELGAQDGKEELEFSGPIIEEVSDEEAERLISGQKSKSLETTSDPVQGEQSSMKNAEASTTSSGSVPVLPNTAAFGDTLNALKQNPEMIRNMHSVMATLSPETIAAMSGGQMSPDMVKIATDMMKQLSPDDMERMVNLASTSQMPLPGGVSSGGAPLSTATDTVSAVPSTSRSGADLSTSGLGATPETSLRSGVQTPGTNMPSMADFSPEMQEQMRKQMKDPAMRQVMTEMVKTMTPEMMTSMSEQLGMKLTHEQAVQAQQAMASLSPETLDRLMVWAERAHKASDQARRAKNWLLGKPGLVLAIVMLVIAVILHRLGYIGS